jgi:hypothetical protein
LHTKPITVSNEWRIGINDGSEAAHPLVLLGAPELVIMHYQVLDHNQLQYCTIES